MKPLLHFTLLALLASLLAASCKGPSKKEAATRDHMHEFHGAFMDYSEANGGWPEKIEDLRPHLPDFDTVMVNPITGDNPGYRYTPPSGEKRKAVNEGDDDRPSDEVMLVQLRNGEPDLTLKKLYSDGSVR